MKLIIVGALGAMGKKVAESAKNYDFEIVCGIDRAQTNIGFPVYSSFDDVKEKADVLIDFSSPSNLDNILSFAVKNNLPCVLCTTGYTEQMIKTIEQTSKKIAIFRSANMSLGINVLLSLVEKASKLLKDFDIEIVEAHHNRKIDAPSGTALMIADKVKEVLPEKHYQMGRNPQTGKRDKDEIGISSIRGGNIVGDHDIMFIGENEKITISHNAFDRKVFADGACVAGKFLVGKKIGLFSMKDILG